MCLKSIKHGMGFASAVASFLTVFSNGCEKADCKHEGEVLPDKVLESISHKIMAFSESKTLVSSESLDDDEYVQMCAVARELNYICQLYVINTQKLSRIMNMKPYFEENKRYVYMFKEDECGIYGFVFRLDNSYHVQRVSVCHAIE